jgi:AMMECR1 domain-containing protein
MQLLSTQHHPPALDHVKGCVETGAHHTQGSAYHQLTGCIGHVALYMWQPKLHSNSTAAAVSDSRNVQ